MTREYLDIPGAPAVLAAQNISANDRAALILMDHPNWRRLNAELDLLKAEKRALLRD